MSTKCNACDKPILSLDYMECSTCKKLYDLLCLVVEPDKFRNFTQDFKDNWLCPSCTGSLPKGNNTNTPIRNPAGSQTSPYATSEGVNLLRGGRRQAKTAEPPSTSGLAELTAEIRQLRIEVQDLKKQNDEIILLRQDVHTLQEQLFSAAATISRFETYEKKIATQGTQIVELRGSIALLQQSCMIQEQKYLKNELEIAGVPESENESLMHIVQVTANKLGIGLAISEVDEVSRAGPLRQRNYTSDTKDSQPRPIVVKLLRHTKRNEIVQAAKSRRNLNSEDIVPGTSKKLYINERLSKANRILFREARQRAQQHNFRYCWTRNGFIFVRAADKKPAVAIRSQDDLEQKVGPAQVSATTGNIHKKDEING